jgi:nucleoside-diphosphate-sugar epimerase
MRLLISGASGVLGSEVCEQLAGLGHAPVRVARRPPAQPGWVAWDMASQPAPESLSGHWDVIVHTAASTRWTMSREEATAANIRPLQAILSLASPRTRLVQVSTAYVARTGDDHGPAFGGYRNGYEWSKARCESLLAHRDGETAIVRPPLILGRSDDGSISRFSGPYTLLQALLSGMAPVIVGDPDGYAEIAPVDLVARAVIAAALAPGSADTIEVVAAGPRCLRLSEVAAILFGTVNGWRADRGLAPIDQPPMLPLDSWHRFFLPFARAHLSPVQCEAVQLMGMFEAYTNMTQPFEPTWPVEGPRDVLVRSIRAWIDAKPRLATRAPQPWKLVGASRSDLPAVQR